MVAIVSVAVLVVGALAFFVGRSIIGGRDGAGPEQGAQPMIIRSSTGAAATGPGFGGEGGEGALLIRLSQGEALAEALALTPLARGEPLSEAEIAAILARLPALTGEEGDVADFRLPEDLLPPPRPGETINEPFPPPVPDVPPVAVAEGPLEVLRFAPEGEIPLAPFLSVTFNQPMVALDTVEALAAADVPVRLTPALPGTWKWAGTKTLTFEYQSDEIDRFPKATEYVAEVPSGTRSAVGGVLDQAVTWRFRTPPAEMTDRYPYGDVPTALEPLIYAAFDQRIDPEAVLNTIQVTADGRAVQTRMASEAEIEDDVTVGRLVKNAASGRWLVFRPSGALPAGATIEVTIGPGTPSAEGPLRTEEAQSFTFNTYAPLRVVEHRCGWYGEGECPPLTPFSIRFNNPLDPESFQVEMLQVEPALPGALVDIVGDSIQIQGATRGRTNYRVTLDAAIQDIFGQTLGEDVRLTFRVGSADQVLSGPGKSLVTLDPSSSEPFFTVYSINHDRLDVRAYAVQPGDYEAYRDFAERYLYDERRPRPPGRLVMEETVRPEAPADALAETNISLAGALEGEYGHLVVVVEPPSGLLSRDRSRYVNTVIAWVQATQIGLDAFVDQQQMVAWASALVDGAPLGGVNLQLLPGRGSATTDSQGTARLDLPADGAGLLVGTLGDDVAILPNSPYYWSAAAWQPRPVNDSLRWYVFDDRQMYRPGEEVHVKGWLRQVGAGPLGDVGLVQGGLSSISYRVMDPQFNELMTGVAEVNALGGFDLSFSLPEQTNLGHARLILNAQGGPGSLGGRQYEHTFQIQEFRRPEFEVTAQTETEGPYYVGESAMVSVSAAYFAGGPLPNAEVYWTVRSSPSTYNPPNWPDFVFGKWRPWWFDFGPLYYEMGETFWPEAEEQRVETFSGVTDASGKHFLRLDFDEAEEPRPFTVSAQGTVMDVNRQAWTSSAGLLVHPGELYVGLHSERTFVERGQPLVIEAIVVDVDGQAAGGRTVDMEAARMTWRYRDGRWAEEAAEIQSCRVTSGQDPVSCTFDTGEGGEYRITAIVQDDQGRQNLSQFTRWVSGGQRPPAREVEQESASLIPDKEEYQPGDVAQILVQAPFSPAEGLLTVSRSGILYTERFALSDGSHTLRVPIEDGHVPNLHIQVDLVGAAPRLDDKGEALEGVPPRPAYASGSLSLPIPPLNRELSVQVRPQETRLSPGGETAIEVSVADAGGRAVADAEIALVVVDEAIMALTNYQQANPLAVMYQNRPPGYESVYGRASIVLANPALLADGVGAAQVVEVTRVVADTVEGEMAVAEMASLPTATMMPAPMAMAAPGADEAAAAPIQVRTDFNPLAVFAPAVRTDSDGRAQVAVKLPDNLTRYRVMVVAVAGGRQYGRGESNLTARLPLMVRPSAPRFLNFGDRFELPVVLQNQTDETLTVDVVVRATNLELSGGAGQRVSVPANDRVEVRFPATTVSPGTVRLQFAAVSGAYADAATDDLPVYTPATTEAFATYGVVDEGAVAQPVAAPEGVFPQFGGLEISTSSTALQALTDAVLYLTSFPYECSEQLASRILAVAALRDVLTAFEAEGLPPPQEIEAAVQRDIDRLQGLQNGDGGFPVWRRGKESIPFYTIHVTHALIRAQEKGFQVPGQSLQMALSYLQDVESHYPHWYGQRVRDTLSAYALYVRYLSGDVDRDKAAGLLNRTGLEELSLEAVAWIWQVLDGGGYQSETEAIRRHINNRAVETAGAANFTTSYGEEAYLLLHSNRRTDGIILETLIATQPDSDLIPKVVNGLLANRTRGRWNNTQENVFILLAMDRYFNTFESQTPEFVARIWLGETYVGQHSYVGRTTERHETAVPMAYLTGLEDGTQPLVLSKEGAGRLYYRLGLRYAPDDLELEPLDRGFVVQRTYEAVDDPEDVTIDGDGTWHIRAGARVRVKLTMVADNRRYHVALVDPLPAGLEIVNPALAVSGDVPGDPEAIPYGWWWWYTWYEHQNMRDERAEAFATLLWDGVYSYSYIARATTPGTFVVPPAKAEEMYSPEVFGRSGSDLVIVEAPDR
jgi:alpha-2-macroglobulin